MDVVQRALWYVEKNFRGPLSLEEIAHDCHTSAFHLTRSFAGVTGLSLMRYVRARRLTEAARALARGAEDILDLALDAGYGSHEAFTRAFRDSFGKTPVDVRARGDLTHIHLQEPFVMSNAPSLPLAPRFETSKPMTLAGTVDHYDCNEVSGIPAQWQRFGEHLGHIPHQVGKVAYGASYNFDGDNSMDYMCGVEVSSTDNLMKGFATLEIPKQRYAVFTHSGHVSTIRSTYAAIWANWFPSSGAKTVPGATIERYGPEFDGRTGTGGLEIWIPIEG